MLQHRLWRVPKAKLRAVQLRKLKKKLVGPDKEPWHAEELYEQLSASGSPAYGDFLWWLSVEPKGTAELRWFERFGRPPTSQELLQIFQNLVFESSNGPLLYVGEVAEILRRYITSYREDPETYRKVLGTKHDVWPAYVYLTFSLMDWLLGESIGPLEQNELVAMFAASHLYVGKYKNNGRTGHRATTGSQKLTLYRIEIPSEVFSVKAQLEDAKLQELAALLCGGSGYALGAPLRIQEDNGLSNVDSGFVLQIDETFGLNLGDNGRLYVSETEVTWDCY